VSTVGAALPARRRVRIDADHVAMVGLVVAGVAHLAAAPDHFDWWPASGWFFLATGAGQVALAVRLAVRRLTPRIALSALLLTAGIIAMYVISRTVGIPGTPPVPLHGARWAAGRSELPNGAKLLGPLDLLTLGAELATGAALFWQLTGRLRAWSANVLLVGGLVLWIGVLIGAS
jgi:hypothetical protein